MNHWHSTTWMNPRCVMWVKEANSEVYILYDSIYAAKSRQSCPTLCDPIDSSPPGSPVPGILQARTLEWVAISFSNARKWKLKVKLLSRVWLLAIPWTAAHQAPPSMGFSRREYWSGSPVPFPMLLSKYQPKNRKITETEIRAGCQGEGRVHKCLRILLGVVEIFGICDYDD